jgi:hypothetical protein
MYLSQVSYSKFQNYPKLTFLLENSMIVPTLPNADSLDHAAAASACCFRPASTTNIYTVSAAAAVRRYHRRHSVPRRCRHHPAC